MTLIEPNLHPILVHFTVGLLVTGALVLALSACAFRGKPWHGSMRSAGDWMLMLGLIAAGATLIAGFFAYYTVAHDAPSHAAMTVHRNWAIGTVIMFAGIGLWRFKRRSASPSAFFAVVLLLATCLLTVTAYRGGALVYEYGIGVQSLPAVSGDGHAHEHMPVSEGHPPAMHSDEHDKAAMPPATAGNGTDETSTQDQEHSDDHDH
jgi:uncharacterized membrane protein